MEKTALDWLLEECPILETFIPKLIWQIAKGMEEEQITDAHFTGSGCNSFDVPEYKINSAYKAAHQYYGEKFGENYGGQDE
jgi:hypothetical protein